MAHTQDMTEGSPAKLLTSFAIPLMLGSICQQLYTMVDAAVVGNFIGIEALGAVGAADWLNWLVLSIMMGFSQGFSILTAQCFGAEDWNGLRKSVTQSLIMTALVSIAVTALALMTMRPILRVMNTPPESFTGAVQYLTVMYSGIIVVAGYNVFASILRALGDSRNPFVAMIIASAMNIVLDLLFVVVLHWGIPGAAIATIMGQVFSCLYCAVCVFRVPRLKMRQEDWRFSKQVVQRIMRLGAPMAFQNTTIGIGGLAVQSVVNGFGYIFLAGFTATNKLYGLLELAAINFGYSMATYAGQNLGAGKYDRIRRGVRTALKIGLGIAVSIGLLMFILGSRLIALFVSDSDPIIVAESIRVGTTYLRFMAACLPVLYMLYIYRSANQGMGDTLMPMASGFVELAMRVSVALLLPIWIGENGVFIAEVSAWIGAVFILLPAYYNRIRKYPHDGAV